MKTQAFIVYVAIRLPNGKLYFGITSTTLRTRIGAANRGRPRTEDTKRRLGAACVGKPMPAEVRAKISMTMKMKKEQNRGEICL